MKIGVFGGTFDPPHLGHLMIAEAAVKALGLDEVVFVPANRNPLKHGRSLASGKHRLEMTRLLVEGEGPYVVSDIDLTRGGPTYSVDTLSELQTAYPGDYWFIVGSDALLTLPGWRHTERLIKLCRIACILRAPHRQEDALRPLPESIRHVVDFVEMPSTPISSTAIRESLEDKGQAYSWLKPSVLKYIEDQGLYAATKA